MKTLSEIYEKYAIYDCPGGQDGDKGSQHSYIPIYEKILEPCRMIKGNFLEIGISAGLSLKMWEEYFPNMIIWGMDINQTCSKYYGNRIYTIIGDSTKDPFLLDFIPFINPCIIIDDGSHQPDDQIRTFVNYFPLLKKDGLYITEDCQGIDYMPEIAKQYQPTSMIMHDLRKIKGRHDDLLFEVYK